MLKNSLCALVLAATSVLQSQIEECKLPKKTILPYEAVIKSISTVERAEEYLVNYLKYEYDIINYGKQDYVSSFKVIHERKKDDCDGGALAAAALLSDNGYPPFMLVMRDTQNRGHAIFIYQEKDLIGCLGINKSDCIRPRFHNLEEVTMYFNFDEYYLVNLDSVASDWKDCNYDLHNKIYRNAKFREVQ